MSSEATIRSSVSEEAVLELLTGAGLDQTQARELLCGNSVADEFRLDQRSTILETHEDQRSVSRGSEQDQSVQQRSTFEQTVLASLEAMDRRLNDLAAKVDGPSEPPETPASNSSHLVTPPTETARRLWADIPVDEVPDYSAPLPSEDGTKVEPSTLQEVSENTKKALTQAFSRPLGYQARLQVRRPYSFLSVRNVPS